MINIKMNTANTINYLTSMPDNLRKAQVSATNKMAAQGLTQARKAIRERYNIQLKHLTGKNSRGQTITQVKKTFTDIKPALIIGYEEGLSLGKFKVKQKPEGVQVEVIKGSPKIIKHAFGPKIARLGKGVWQRVGKERTPIVRRLGPGPATMLRARKVSKTVIDFVNQKFKSIMDHEIKYFLKIK
ncbi:MAG: hypothetical protein IPL84_03745 [Chitinophagaceae bacterium]|nr:hypothetical protein [Chitinophagaceae bacterium]